jgi:hypothetical protein
MTTIRTLSQYFPTHVHLNSVDLNPVAPTEIRRFGSKRGPLASDPDVLPRFPVRDKASWY